MVFHNKLRSIINCYIQRGYVITSHLLSSHSEYFIRNKNLSKTIKSQCMCIAVDTVEEFSIELQSGYIGRIVSIYILITQLLWMCLSRINWKDYESQKAENLYPGVILYCDNDLLVFEAKFGIMTSQLRKIDI